MYGIIDGEEIAPKVMKVKIWWKKPDKAAAPSNVAILGRYTGAEIFDILSIETGKNGKYATDAKTLFNYTGYILI